MKRYFVTTQFAVDARDPQAAEMIVARRLQDLLGVTDVVCEGCGTTTKRPGGNAHARVVVDAAIATDETFLRDGPAMLTEETGYVPVEGGRPIPGDSSR